MNKYLYFSSLLVFSDNLTGSLSQTIYLDSDSILYTRSASRGKYILSCNSNMTAATALCTPNNVFYQRILSLNRPSLPVALRQNNPSVICTSKSTTIVCRSSEVQFESDENNNSRTVKNLIEEVLLITSDEEEDDNELLDDKISHEQNQQIDTKPIVNEIDEELFLSFVGLRMKTKKIEKSLPTMKTLTKRWATPLCLLPLPKHNERVRQALYSSLPSLKFLRITNDIERFCATDSSIRNRNLSSPLSSVRSRKSKSSLMKIENKRKSNVSSTYRSLIFRVLF